MSSDVIAGLNSAQFTNDNKHAYYYSGMVDFGLMSAKRAEMIARNYK